MKINLRSKTGFVLFAIGKKLGSTIGEEKRGNFQSIMTIDVAQVPDPAVNAFVAFFAVNVIPLWP
jgi:hypothetical protein